MPKITIELQDYTEDFLTKILGVGGEVTRAKTSHDRLFNHEGFKESLSEGFIKKSDSGSSYDYLSYKITERGREAFRQLRALSKDK